MKQQRKYLAILSAPGCSKERFLTDDESELLDRVCAFRQETHPHRVEIYTAGEPGYEWLDDEGYSFVDPKA